MKKEFTWVDWQENRLQVRFEAWKSYTQGKENAKLDEYKQVTKMRFESWKADHNNKFKTERSQYTLQEFLEYEEEVKQHDKWSREH